MIKIESRKLTLTLPVLEKNRNSGIASIPQQDLNEIEANDFVDVRIVSKENESLIYTTTMSGSEIFAKTSVMSKYSQDQGRRYFKVLAYR